MEKGSDRTGRQAVPAGVALSPKERRRQTRTPYRTVQRIAPIGEFEFPDDSEFFSVHCHDLSQGGFSFLMPVRPDFSMLAAELGTREKPIYVLCKVAHTADVMVDASGRIKPMRNRLGMAVWHGQEKEGKPMVLIGCRFLRRMQKPQTRRGNWSRA